MLQDRFVDIEIYLCVQAKYQQPRGYPYFWHLEWMTSNHTAVDEYGPLTVRHNVQLALTLEGPIQEISLLQRCVYVVFIVSFHSIVAAQCKATREREVIE